MNHENGIFFVLKCEIKINAKGTFNACAWQEHKLCAAGHVACVHHD